MNLSKKSIQDLLSLAGITVNGYNVWDIKVNDDLFYKRVMSGGILGLGDAYVDGLWDCRNLDDFFYKVIRADLEKKVKQNSRVFIQLLLGKFFNMHSRSKAYSIGQRHYDL